MVPYKAWSERNSTDFCERIYENGGILSFWDGSDDFYEWQTMCEEGTDEAKNKIDPVSKEDLQF